MDMDVVITGLNISTTMTVISGSLLLGSKTTYLGSNCSADTVDHKNRTLTCGFPLSNSNLVIKSKETLIEGLNQEYVVTGNLITFFIEVYDDDVIVVVPGACLTSDITEKTLYLGSSCDGADGEKLRTLTCTKSIGANNIIIKSKEPLTEGVGQDYTVSGTVITFLIEVYDDDTIVVMA
jgi:hypothetical protein